MPLPAAFLIDSRPRKGDLSDLDLECIVDRSPMEIDIDPITVNLPN